MRLSIARRLALMFALAGIVVFVTGAVLLQQSLMMALEQQQEEELSLRVAVLEPILGKKETDEDWIRVRTRLDALTPTDQTVRFWILSTEARYRYGTGLERQEQWQHLPDGFGTLHLPDMDRPMKTLLKTVPARGERPDVRFMVALNPTPFLHTQERFHLTLGILLFAGAVIVATLGYWVSRIGLRPLRRLSDAAHTLSPRNLSQRLPQENLPPELETLAVSFNGALQRLEAAYKQLESFNADVAHELRTPLTNLIGQTQVGLSRERNAGELEDVLLSNLEELERLRAIINDMLFLARVDQGETARNRVQTDLAVEVEKTAEFLDPLLDEAAMTVRIAGQESVPVETALFRRAMANLLHNAVQHSATGSEILVSLRREVRRDTDVVFVEVSNPGEPIAAKHLPHLFDRFYRVDAARRGSDESHGLGLSIVKAIAAMHGGTVFARSEAGRNTIGFTLSAMG